MSKHIPSLENKKPFHRRNGSGDLDVFEAACYFSAGAGTHLRQKYCMRESVGRLSLDMPNYHRRNSIPLQDMMIDNHHPIIVKKEKNKHKPPSSPGGKLAHFLNTLFNQTSSKKKSKSTTATQSIKDDDVSPSGWRRKRRSSISLFRSGNSNTTSIVSDPNPKPPFSPCHLAQTPTKSTVSEITKIPIKENHTKIETLKGKSDFLVKEGGFGNGFLEKVKNICDDGDKEFKNFMAEDGDYGDSDSSSDLFELTNCDFGYNSSGLPVFETTHIDSIKRGVPISS